MKKRFAWLGTLLLVVMVTGIAFVYCWEMGLFLPPDDSATSWTPAESEPGSEASVGEESSSAEQQDGPPLVDLAAVNYMLPAYTRTDGVIDAPYGVTYTIHSVEITKDLPDDMRLPEYNETNYMIDLDGTIVRDYSYVIVDMTVVNDEFVYSDFSLNGIQVMAVDSERIFLDYLSRSEDAVSISNDIPGAGSTEPLFPGQPTWYSSGEFKTGDTLRYKAACILRDSDLAAAEHLILIPTAVHAIANGYVLYDDVKETSYWNNGVHAILLDDYIAGQTVPVSSYEPPLPPRPVCTEGELVFGRDHRDHMTLEQVTVVPELPEGVYRFTQREPQPGVNADGTLKDGYVWLQVSGLLEDKIALESINIYIFGSDLLYFYRGEERLGLLFPYALQTDDTIQRDSSEPHHLYCYLSAEGPSAFSYYFAVPEERLQDDTDLLLMMCGNENDSGYTTEHYDRENRCCFWNPAAVFADLTTYVK